MKVFAVNQMVWVLIFLLSIYLQKQNIKNHFVNYLHDLRIVFFVFLMYWIFDKKAENRKYLVFSGVFISFFVNQNGFFFKRMNGVFLLIVP